MTPNSKQRSLSVMAAMYIDMYVFYTTDQLNNIFVKSKPLAVLLW